MYARFPCEDSDGPQLFMSLGKEESLHQICTIISQRVRASFFLYFLMTDILTHPPLCPVNLTTYTNPTSVTTIDPINPVASGILR